MFFSYGFDEKLVYLTRAIKNRSKKVFDEKLNFLIRLD